MLTCIRSERLDRPNALYSPVIPTTILIRVEIVHVPRRVEGSHPPVRREGQVDQDDESHDGGAPKNKKVIDQDGEGLFENPGRNIVGLSG